MRIRQCAYFCVSSKTTHAEEMTSRIGLAPDETTTRGSRQTGDIVLPADHSWSGYATEQARPVDDQVSEPVARLLPCRDAIAALINDPKANCSAQINVVRRFNGPDGEEEKGERVDTPVGVSNNVAMRRLTHNRETRLRNKLRPAVLVPDCCGVTMHEGQIAVSAGQVRALVDRQFPQWRDLPVREFTSAGTVNAIFRIGEHYAARFPLQPMAADAAMHLLRAEAEAGRELAGRTRFPAPEPVAIGEPGEGYPLPWAVQTWLPGTVASDEDPGASVQFACDLAEFISGVRSIDTRGRTFRGDGRGGADLRIHDAWMETCFRHSERLLDVPVLRRLWADFRVLPRKAPDVMTHGDLMPGNVLVSDGRLAGILDVGGLGPADPALDLVGGWHLLDLAPRQVLRDALGSDDLEWQRGMAWAFQQSMGLVWYYADSNPVMSRTGRRTLERIVAERIR